MLSVHAFAGLLPANRAADTSIVLDFWYYCKEIQTFHRWRRKPRLNNAFLYFDFNVTPSSSIDLCYTNWNQCFERVSYLRTPPQAWIHDTLAMCVWYVGYICIHLDTKTTQILYIFLIMFNNDSYNSLNCEADYYTSTVARVILKYCECQKDDARAFR